MLFASGCKTTKHISSSIVNKDSLVIKEKADSIRLLSNEINRLSAEIRELQYSGVRFDTVMIPGDTVRVINTVTITKEGDITATGKILAAYVSKDKLTKIVNEKQKIIDSLSLLKQKEIVKVEIKTVDKEVFIKRSTFNIWYYVICFILGIVFWAKFGGKIKLFFKTIIPKT